jgi:hypothetical protein
METFLDGGLFEFFIALSVAVFLNFIFLKRYLLIVFSLIIIASPVVLFFIPKNELFYWVVSFSLFNSILLVVLLWKVKTESPQMPLFRVENLKIRLSGTLQKINIFFKNRLSKTKA